VEESAAAIGAAEIVAATAPAASSGMKIGRVTLTVVLLRSLASM
jgi:hypothetical protein